jgi:hypothetical protein
MARMSDDVKTPAVPSAWSLERAVSAYQQIRAALDADPDLEADEAVINAALAAADAQHPEALLERLIDAAVWMQRREDEADELRKEVTARRDRYATRRETIRLTITELLEVLDKKSHRGRLGLASVVMAPPSVVITDDEALPDEYVRIAIARSPNKTLIREDIDNGVVIPGATLSNSAPILRIKRL